MDSRLENIFYPKTIAVIGASARPEKVGNIIVASLLEAGFRGRIYPVNRGLSSLYGLRVYPSLSAIPGEIDLALIAIPAALTITALRECIDRGVKGAIIASGGFGEVGTKDGQKLQAKLRELAGSRRTIVIGPNTVGLTNPGYNLNASFQTTFSRLKPGGAAVIAQSGGMCTFISHTLSNYNVGISKALSLGNRYGLDFNEAIAYLGEDRETRVIVLYIEGLKNPRRLLAAAGEVIKHKPIVAYKAGRGQGIERSTLSHTGALAGDYELYRAAFRQTGILTAESINDLADAAKALSAQPPAAGDRVAVLSVQAGPAIVMADRCQHHGLKLAQFSAETRQRLREIISPLNAADNPVDVGWVSGQRDACREMLEMVLQDEGVDGLAVSSVFLETTMGLMWAVADIAAHSPKPITVCLDSPHGEAQAELAALHSAGIPTYPLPEPAVDGLAALVSYGKIRRSFSGGGGGIRTHG